MFEITIYSKVADYFVEIIGDNKYYYHITSQKSHICICSKKSITLHIINNEIKRTYYFKNTYKHNCATINFYNTKNAIQLFTITDETYGFMIKKGVLTFIK